MKAYNLDTETTGLVDPELIEIAWLKLDSPKILSVDDDFHQRYKPSKPIEPEAMAVNNIIDADLIDCPPSSSFKLPEDCGYLIGHNIDYDWGVIGKPDVKRICTRWLARYLFPELKSFKQSALLYALCPDQAATRDSLKESHSALGDVFNNLTLLRILVDKAGGVDTWEDLWLLSEKARVPTMMLNGKHKGVLIKDLPSDYINWLLKQDNLDPYLKKAIDQI